MLIGYNRLQLMHEPFTVELLKLLLMVGFHSAEYAINARTIYCIIIEAVPIN